MARKIRIQFPGAIYHVMNRGDHQERIFGDDEDRRRFLVTLEEACEKTARQIHSFCLMSNHFHLVLETPNANLVEGMKWFLGVYTRRFNLRHKFFGHLFSSRYKALMVEGSGSGYLKWSNNAASGTTGQSFGNPPKPRPSTLSARPSGTRPAIRDLQKRLMRKWTRFVNHQSCAEIPNPRKKS